MIKLKGKVINLPKLGRGVVDRFCSPHYIVRFEEAQKGLSYYPSPFIPADVEGAKEKRWALFSRAYIEANLKPSAEDDFFCP